jgi:hypothetical protein
MTQTTPVDYAELLLDLRNKRRQIDQAIVGIEALIALQAPIELGDPLNAGAPKSSEDHRLTKVHAPGDQDSGPFFDKSILSAARGLLAKSEQPLTATALAQSLIAGGYPARSKNFSNTVAAVLNRCDKTGGNVIRVGKNLFTLVNQRHNLATRNQGDSNE